MAARIVCVGECMVELSPADQPSLMRSGFAGDTFNTAWYLARLCPEARIDYATHVGRDAISDAMVAFIAEAGIGTDHIIRRDDATVGLYQITLDRGERSFTYWRGQSAARGLAGDAGALRRAFAGADLVYFSGITLAILPPEGRDTLLAEVANARRAGSRIAFDPNLRPALWEDPDTMRACVTQAAGGAEIVLPSHEDEATWFGDASSTATRDRYRQAGASEIIVKDGAGPVLAATPDGDLSIEPEPVEAVDSTAAGDSFNAGYLAARIEGQGVEQAVRRGMALARRVVCHRGALIAPDT